MLAKLLRTFKVHFQPQNQSNLYKNWFILKRAKVLCVFVFQIADFVEKIRDLKKKYI